jgi:hypothetical protein
MANRRQFLKTSMAAAGTAALGLAGLGSPRPGEAHTGKGTEPDTSLRRKAPRPIRLLILGGTGFIGPWQVRYAKERGHEVTIFNRGRSAPGMFSGVEELTGDRAAGELGALRGRTWDAVIDNSAARADAPEWIQRSILAWRAERGMAPSSRIRSVPGGHRRCDASVPSLQGPGTTRPVEGGTRSRAGTGRPPGVEGAGGSRRVKPRSRPGPVIRGRPGCRSPLPVRPRPGPGAPG